ncbi:type I-E CRISPR-associated protein Cas6/Cse3/CasE [Leucobacter viscericola]|uniref:Type I-E CRISPR-associated protein Cas6/Cse3/CasE n=1 Tax=Leucobacter viscericola TaxID=2714935 RepID=A0A6G7XGU5_9MICO|nr:type I-E CRISPR-associated protein Cas6/Cse3/CasE [Leucobacter viscericola]QIK63598.1 type I-E CRISPR-associated protein Cas6/Cse3/CasE [Leucobacter viscericola]
MPVSQFLSRVPLHALSAKSGARTRRHITDNPAQQHSEVMSLFGHIEGDTVRADTNVLFRVDPPHGNQAATVLIRSSIVPSRPAEGLETRQEGPVPPAGTPVAFRIAINAIRRRSVESSTAKRKTILTPVPRDDDPAPDGTTMTDWLSARLAGGLSSVEILNHDRQVLGVGTKCTVQTDLVDGFAIVEDSAKLAQMLIHGVGRAKSYGCGLLSLRPLS